MRCLHIYFFIVTERYTSISLSTGLNQRVPEVLPCGKFRNRASQDEGKIFEVPVWVAVGNPLINMEGCHLNGFTCNLQLGSLGCSPPMLMLVILIVIMFQ